MGFDLASALMRWREGSWSFWYVEYQNRLGNNEVMATTVPILRKQKCLSNFSVSVMGAIGIRLLRSRKLGRSSPVILVNGTLKSIEKWLIYR
jgi:hypothetical protein